MAGALIGALRVSLSAETSAFEAGMKRSQKTAQRTANSITSSFKTAGGAMGALKAGVAGFIASLSVGTIIAAGKAALDYAGSLAEVAQQLGVTTKDLQVLRYAAGQVGVSQEQLETGLSKLTITLGRVAAGAAEPTKALNAIGISVDDLKNKDSGEAFRIIADGLQKVTDRSQRAAVEVALFGKSGAKLDNLLSGGSKQVNELADAAERLGIVLSDEQIQKADDTADKLEALSTVLKAKIAGEVADNASSILQLADALIELVNTAQRASAAWVDFTTNLARKWSIPAQLNKLINGSVYGFDTAGSSVTVPIGSNKQADARFGALFRGRANRGGGASIGNFLASGGGGGSRRGGGGRDDAERQRQQALRDQNQFDQEIRRANIDILNAKKDLATDAIEQYNISIQIKDAERAAYEAQLKYEVAAGEKGKVEADQLLAAYDIKDSLERQKMVADESARAAEESAHYNETLFDLERDRLQSEQQLAETASERREVELRLLDLAYRQERARLEAIIADEKSSLLAKDEAQLRLNNLNKTYANDRQSVLNNTRGPMEEYLASLPTTAAKAEEALQRLQVQGFEGLIDAALALSDGFKSAKDALLQTLKDFLLGLARMELQKALGGFLQGGGGGIGGFFSSLLGSGGGNAIASGAGSAAGGGGFFGLPGFATGGMVRVLGRTGVDRNVVSINGIPQFRVGYGERMSISNDNAQTRTRGGALVQNFNFPNSDFDSFRRNQSQVARDSRRRLGV